MKKLLSKVLLPLVLLAAVAIVWTLVTRQRDPFAGGKVRVGYQESDFPLMTPAKGEVDQRFNLLTAWQHASIPKAVRFDPPMGSEHGGLVYNAQQFWEMNEARGGPHFGDDLNGIGGMNTDLGDPVFAIGDGLVLYSGEPSSGWGNVVVVAHRSTDGRLLQSMYAHLDKIVVARGALVARGTRIGTVGNAHGNYPAHLHFEMRDTDEVEIGPGYGDKPLNRLDPAATVAGLRGGAADELAPSALAITMKPDESPWSRLETQDAKSAQRLLEIISGQKAEK